MSASFGFWWDKSLANIWAVDSLGGPPTHHGGVCSVRGTGGKAHQSVPLHGLPDPLHVVADFGVDARLGGGVTGDVTPGDNALQGTPADQGSPRVTLWGGKRGISG